VGENIFHRMAHGCDLSLIVKKSFHDRLHIVCGTILVELLPVNEEMRSLHVDGEGEVRRVLDGWDEAGVGVELVEIANNDGTVTGTWMQLLERHV
jgi:hypothetical protein